MARRGQEIDFTIKIGDGYPLVYYPRPELGIKTRDVVNEQGIHGKLTQAHSMNWKFKLSKKAPEGLPVPPPDHWWNIARRVPSDYVLMNDTEAGNERFVFYEGTTWESPVVTAAVSEETIRIANNYSADSAPVILIINDLGSRSCAYIESVPAGRSVEFSRDKFEPWNDEELLAYCRKQWEVCGMTPEEAESIVGCWRDELLKKPGFLLVSRVPEAIYEKVFPLQMKPKPTELRRACLVFDTLPGNDARRHWLPNIRKESEAIVAGLAEDGFKERMAARSKLLAMGEIATPFVNELLADSATDPQSRIAASNIRRILAESQVCVPPKMRDNPNPGGLISSPGFDGVTIEKLEPLPPPVIIRDTKDEFTPVDE